LCAAGIGLIEILGIGAIHREAEEWRELAALTDRLELLHADRLTALAELAKLRGVTLDEVMNRLGIQLPLG
jgi:hypothetical protein